jgi:hypothetical protein
MQMDNTWSRCEKEVPPERQVVIAVFREDFWFDLHHSVGSLPHLVHEFVSSHLSHQAVLFKVELRVFLNRILNFLNVVVNRCRIQHFAHLLLIKCTLVSLFQQIWVRYV